MDDLKKQIIQDVTRWGDLGVSAESDQNHIDQIADRCLSYPGTAFEVWGGWVWITDDGTEHGWSKAATRAKCEKMVYEVVERLGLKAAFSPD